MARHQCKHLLALVMEWLPPFDSDILLGQIKQDRERHEQKMAWLQRRLARFKRGDYSPHPEDPRPEEDELMLPSDVAAALNIYRHEEIEKMRFGDPWTDEDWARGKARKIADGALDRKKQSGFYVHIGKSGQVGLHPGLIAREEASAEIERAKRLSDAPVTFSNEYRALVKTLPIVFANL